MVEVLPRRCGRRGSPPGSSRSSTWRRPALPPGYSRAAADRLAAQALAGSRRRAVDRDARARPAICCTPRRSSAPRDGRPTGVVVATDYLTGDLAARSRRMTQAFENYNQLRVLKRPLTGVYLSFFLMVTLLILVGATWMGSYLAEADHAAGADAAPRRRARSAPGRLDQRVEPQSNDEFGSLVEAFNTMAGELADEPPQAWSASTIELERKHLEVEGRRRYIETILERITTGVVSVDAAGAITTINSAAARLLSLDRQIVGQPARAVFDRADLQPLGDAARRRRRAAEAEPAAQEIAIPREGQELHLAVVATALVGDSGAPEGVGARARRRHAADPGAEGGGVARGGARGWRTRSRTR